MSPSGSSASRVLRRGSAAVVAAAVLGGLVAGLAAAVGPTSWTATAYVIVDVDPTNLTATVQDRTTASEAAYAMSDGVVADVQSEAGNQGAYSVDVVAGTNGLTFQAVATTSAGAVDLVETAANVYVDSRQADLQQQLQGQVDAAQADADDVSDRLAAVPQNDATLSRRTALGDQLTASLLQVQEKQQQLDTLPQVASILNLDQSASRNGPSTILVVALGAVLAATVLVLVLLLRERVSPRVGREIAAQDDEDVLVFTSGRVGRRGRHGSVDLDLGAAAVVGSISTPGAVVAVVGPAEPALLRSVVERLAHSGGNKGGTADVLDVIGEVGVSERIAAAVDAARQGQRPLYVVADGAAASQTLGQVARKGDTAFVVVVPDVSREEEASEVVTPLRRSAARVAWLVATRQ